MKIIHFLSVLICILLSATFQSISQPQISFPQGTTYDWGNVKPGQNPLSGKFLIKNTGNETLQITGVKPSCGCTSAPLEKYSLLPNESTELKVELNISSYDGRIEKYIDVYSNDPAVSQKRLTLIANIERLIKVEPGHIVSFMQMHIGENQTQTVHIKNLTNHDVQISLKDYNPKNLLLNLQSPRIIKKGESFPLDISINAKEKGIIKGKILIATNDSDFPEVEVFVFGDIQPSPIFIGN